jgi:filamentous hemagglutinin
MATYEPPTEDLTYPDGFNPLVFQQLTDALTIEEGDARYLRFPLGQGAEQIPTLTVSGTSTLAGATYSAGTSPAYEIEYPVNNGRFDFYTKTGGGTRTRGSKIDATGVHTVSTLDTIDEVGGTLNIGTAVARTGTIQIGGATGTGAGRAINIGTTSSTGTQTLNLAGSTITVGSANTSTLSVNPNDTSALRLGNNMTGGTITIGGATTTSTAITIGNGSNQSGAISIGTGASASKAITIGNVSGAFGTLNLGCATISIANASNTTALNLGTGMTSGTTTIGGSGTNALSIQRPLVLTSGADPASATSAIGFILTNITGTSGAISAPTNTYTWSTGAMTLPIGVYMLSLYAEYVSTGITAFVINLGFMSSAPTTGDSATASNAPTNTISGINGNLRNSDPITLDNGTYIQNIGGVVVNNYGGTFNSIYGIMNADWSAGTITMTALTIRAVKIA